jgi:hypothetical protein
MTADRASASALAIFALFVIWQSQQFPLGTFHRPGPAYVPVLLASLLLIFAVCLLITAGRAPSLSSIRWSEWRHASVILALLSFAAYAIDRLGYRLTMLIVLGVLVKLVEKRGWLSSIVFSVTLSFGSFYLFYTALRVPLPLGPWGF